MYLVLFAVRTMYRADDIMRQQTQFILHLIFVLLFSGLVGRNVTENERIACEFIFVCSAANSVPTVKHSIWAALFDTHENI